MNEAEKVTLENDLEQSGEITLFDGKPFSGTCVDYHENGEKRSEQFYKDGKEHGISTGWYENGTKSHEYYFKDGQANGLWRRWYPNGQMTFKKNTTMEN